MRRIAVSISCALALAVPVQAQSSGRGAPHGVMEDSLHVAGFVELGGNGVLLCCSLNADAMVSPHTSIRVGAGAELLTDDSTPKLSVFAMINRLVGSDGRYLELGAGVMRSNIAARPGPARLGPTVAIGYRLERDGKLFRVTVTPWLPPFAGQLMPGRRMIRSIGVSRGWYF